MTEILSAYLPDGTTLNPAAIEQAAAALQAGLLVAFPTETVYGLGANAFNAAAVAGVFAAKQRPATDPLIVHIGAREQVSQVAENWPAVAETLMQTFWPGPLTLVLPRHPHLPPEISAGRATVAVRMPAHPVALALINACGFPLVGPSANLFSHTSPTLAAHVAADLTGRIDLILDGGSTYIGLESTVVDLTSSPPRLLRPGGLTTETLQVFLPDLDPTPPSLPANLPLPGPGLLAQHYAPHTPLTYFSGENPSALYTALHQFAAEHGRVGLLVADEDLPALADLSPKHVHIRAIASYFDPASAAQRLYAAVRELDALDLVALAARSFPTMGLGAALHDRLTRAAAHVIELPPLAPTEHHHHAH